MVELAIEEEGVLGNLAKDYVGVSTDVKRHFHLDSPASLKGGYRLLVAQHTLLPFDS